MNLATTALMLGIVHPPTWATCTMNRAGSAENGIIYIHLRHNDGTFNHWFKAFPGIKKEILATAIAAMNASANIKVHLEGTEAYSQINRFYVSANPSASKHINSAISLLLLEDKAGIPYTGIPVNYGVTVPITSMVWHHLGRQSIKTFFSARIDSASLSEEVELQLRRFMDRPVWCMALSICVSSQMVCTFS